MMVLLPLLAGSGDIPAEHLLQDKYWIVVISLKSRCSFLFPLFLMQFLLLEAVFETSVLSELKEVK